MLLAVKYRDSLWIMRTDILQSTFCIIFPSSLALEDSSLLSFDSEGAILAKVIVTICHQISQDLLLHYIFFNLKMDFVITNSEMDPFSLHVQIDM